MSMVSKNGMKRDKARENGTMEDSAFHQLFVAQLKDIYWAENNLVKALPKMQKAATSPELAEAIGSHLEETRGQVTRLEEIFELIGEKAKGEKCEAMDGLLKEGTQMVDETPKGTHVRDAAIIMAAQKIEHYEIATYGGLKALAEEMGHTEAARLLDQTLEEEKKADTSLNELALSRINEEAAKE